MDGRIRYTKEDLLVLKDIINDGDPHAYLHIIHSLPEAYQSFDFNINDYTKKITMDQPSEYFENYIMGVIEHSFQPKDTRNYHFFAVMLYSPLEDIPLYINEFEGVHLAQTLLKWRLKIGK